MADMRIACLDFYLLVTGGTKVNEVTKRVLKLLITDILAKLFNYMGHSYTHAFSALLMLKDTVLGLNYGLGSTLRLLICDEETRTRAATGKRSTI
jgi:flagellar biosynthesis protein FliR